jgi:hypothetical protein
VTAEPLTFAITWDYRCPYARIAHDHVVTGLVSGAPWDVTFIPFNLDQPHVEDSEMPVWDQPDRYPGLLATAAGVVVRDEWPDQFLTTHAALFAARHDRSRDLRRRDVLASVLDESGVDGAAVLAAIDDGWPLETFRKEHEAAVAEHAVFGVPTFIAGGRAVFIRLLDRPNGDAVLATKTVERLIDLTAGWDSLNEFKQTIVPR